MDYLAGLFDISAFMPHGYCFLWRWDLLLLHVGSDLLIALAYFSISAALLVFMRRRKDIPFTGLLRLFIGFILACGTTHMFTIVVVWYPAYTIEGLLKLATAAISVTTAIAIWPLIPRAVALPSTEILESRNRDIQELNEKLENRIESLGTLAGGVSHDFNNLLTVIQGHAELLSMSLASDQDKESLQAIKDASDRAADLCRQMLAFSGKGHFIFAPVELNEIVRNIEIPPDANCSISYSLSDQIQPIPAAKDQLGQLVQGLLLNAIEAIQDRQVDDGEIHISTSMTDLDREDLADTIVETRAAPGQFAMVAFKDNGIGMHRDLITRIFDPYYSTKFTGRGLGLSAIQGIVRGHRGCIFVESEPLKGTTIRVALPLTQPEPSHYREQPATSDGRPLVLVVDDEPQVLELATNYLTKLNADVLTTTDPLEAVKIVEQHQDELDAVILDYLMPKITGREVLRKIRKISEVKVYLISGFSRGEINDTYLHEQLSGFISKPFTFSDFSSIFIQQSREQTGT